MRVSLFAFVVLIAVFFAPGQVNNNDINPLPPEFLKYNLRFAPILYLIDAPLLRMFFDYPSYIPIEILSKRIPQGTLGVKGLKYAQTCYIN